MKISEELSKYDTISLKDTSLIIDSGENQIDLKLQYCHFKSLKDSIVNQLGDEEIIDFVSNILKNMPDNLQEKVWSNLYDDKSYQELEKENYKLKVKNEDLQISYINKKEQYLSLKYGR